MARNERVVYIRFGRHVPILDERPNLTIYRLETGNSFESFSREVHSIITREGRDVLYVFDLLSDLLHIWATDLMIGDFFVITCPYLFQLNTIAYFALLRNSHSFKTVARIRETTQLLVDVYNAETNFYIHPLKVLNRYTPTMFFPHLKKGNTFTPIIDSIEATYLIKHIQKRGLESTLRILDYWDRTFLRAEDLAMSQKARPGSGRKTAASAAVSSTLVAWPGT